MGSLCHLLLCVHFHDERNLAVAYYCRKVAGNTCNTSGRPEVTPSSAHMDEEEAERETWELQPFYLRGRFFSRKFTQNGLGLNKHGTGCRYFLPLTKWCQRMERWHRTRLRNLHPSLYLYAEVSASRVARERRIIKDMALKQEQVIVRQETVVSKDEHHPVERMKLSRASHPPS